MESSLSVGIISDHAKTANILPVNQFVTFVYAAWSECSLKPEHADSHSTMSKHRFMPPTASEQERRKVTGGHLMKLLFHRRSVLLPRCLFNRAAT